MQQRKNESHRSKVQFNRCFYFFFIIVYLYNRINLTRSFNLNDFFQIRCTKNILIYSILTFFYILI